MVPKAFIECEVRIYDKRRLKDRAKDDEEALRYSSINYLPHALNFDHIFCTEMP